MVRTWLQRNEGRCTPGAIARGFERMNFCMGLAGSRMPALAYDLAVPDNDAPDYWIRVRRVDAFCSQTHGLRHEIAI